VPNLGGGGGVLNPGGGGGGRVPNPGESSLMGAHYYLNAGGVGSGRSFRQIVGPGWSPDSNRRQAPPARWKAHWYQTCESS
jgi:hypothetical protein